MSGENFAVQKTYLKHLGTDTRVERLLEVRRHVAIVHKMNSIGDAGLFNVLSCALYCSVEIVIVSTMHPIFAAYIKFVSIDTNAG
jgi:hypothetical protein